MEPGKTRSNWRAQIRNEDWQKVAVQVGHVDDVSGRVAVAAEHGQRRPVERGRARLQSRVYHLEAARRRLGWRTRTCAVKQSIDNNFKG